MGIDLSKFKPTGNNAPPPQAAPQPAGALEGLGAAAVFEKGVPLENGTYICTVDAVKLFPSRKKAGHVFVVEFIVKEVINGTAKPGERRSWIQTINPVGDQKQRPMALSAIKQFVLAAVNPGTAAEKQAVSENAREIILAASSESQDLKGYDVKVSSTTTTPKKPGDPTFQQLSFNGV